MHLKAFVFSWTSALSTLFVIFYNSYLVWASYPTTRQTSSLDDLVLFSILMYMDIHEYCSSRRTKDKIGKLFNGERIKKGMKNELDLSLLC